MNDRKGLSYETLVSIQTADLALWGSKCLPEVIAPVTEYVRGQNRCATQPEETHRVYRGGDLIEIIRQWPDLKSPYAHAESVLKERSLTHPGNINTGHPATQIPPHVMRQISRPLPVAPETFKLPSLDDV